MTATYNIWGNVNNTAYALPMTQVIPSIPLTQGYVLAWDIVEQALGYAPLSFDFANGDASNAGNFNLAAGKVFKINGVQVLKAPITGWQPSSGTPSRATFDVSTITLSELASRFKQLVDDLKTHGLLSV